MALYITPKREVVISDKYMYRYKVKQKEKPLTEKPSGKLKISCLNVEYKPEPERMTRRTKALYTI